MEQTIKETIETVLQELGITDVSFVVEHPVDLSHGDYACNVAMVAAKKVGKNPREFAEELVALIIEKKVQYIQKCEVAGPGFINFSLHRDFFKKEMLRAIALGEDWGKNEIYAGKKVFVEYTDPNPFKEFHVGHLFTNSVGESISRLFVYAGADTKRLCYQGDVGMHVAHAIWGLQKLEALAEHNEVAKLTPVILGKAYAVGATAYKEDETAAEEIKILNKKIYERTDESVNALYDTGKEVSLAYFDTIYDTVGTSFDHKFFESEAGPKGKELVLNNSDIFPESNGARIFDGEAHGLHTRVFVNSEGLPTYEAKELALAKMKEDVLGTYDLSIISTSNEITEYFKVLKKAMCFIYPELEKKTEHIGHGTVRLSTGKMSSRTGDVIPAVTFIDEIANAVSERMAAASSELAKDTQLTRHIALGAIKYATLKGNILQDTVFDKEQALSFEGASGPYLQYTHARICSVLEKASTANISVDTTQTPENPYEIEKVLYRFQEVLTDAAIARAPHKVATYLTELAGMFNSFYAQEKIADPADQYAPYKTQVAQAVAQTLKNGLWVLGIEEPKAM